MLTWLLVNLLLSVLALGFIALNDSAPHRLRFFAGFAALVAWLVPWPLVPDLLPGNMFSVEIWRIERAVEAGSTRLTGVVPIIVATGAMPARDFVVFSVLELGLITLSGVGCVLFTWKLIAHRLLLRTLERQGAEGNWLWARAGLAPVCPLGVQRAIPGAFSSGLLKPRIWVHGDLVHSPQLATVLRHELTHIRQHDNWYLLVITLVERLFWWNPLVWYLGRGTRELQELSCDELCQRSNADYPAQLAQLMLDSARSGQPRMLALGANIFNYPNPDVKRIKLLQRSYPMMKKHKLAAALTAAGAFVAVGFVTAQPDAAEAGAGTRVEMFRLERTPGTADDVLFVAAAEGAGEPRLVTHGMGPGGGDQYVRIAAANGRESISFSFADAPLPAVLMPLVGFVSHKLPGPGAMDVAMVRALDEDSDTIYGMAPDEVIEKVKEEGGSATWVEDGRVVTFAATHVAPGAGPGTGMGPGGFQARFAVGPLSENLVLEYPDAANRLVSVTVADKTIDEALEAIAEASGCNIFQDDDTIVVDYCEE